jgi:AbrB family looped-hinge helix DNA binding protein
MTHVTVSSKYQVVIPKDVRRQVPLRTGQKLVIIVKDGLITLLPDRPLASFRGFLKDMKTGEIREKRDRF